MFTGLIEEIGSIKSIRPSGDGFILEILSDRVIEDCKIGDSISINGACQTISDIGNRSFSVYVSRVTGAVTTLGSMKPGERVNLERAMLPSSRFGGHLVQGHVDGVGEVMSIKEDPNGLEIEIRASEDITRYIVDKGSIATDGISLTIVSLNEKSFILYIIPETKKNTIVMDWKVGRKINIEIDIIAKYVEKMLNIKDWERESGEDLKRKLSEEGYL